MLILRTSSACGSWLQKKGGQFKRNDSKKPQEWQFLLIIISDGYLHILNNIVKYLNACVRERRPANAVKMICMFQKYLMILFSLCFDFVFILELELIILMIFYNWIYSCNDFLHSIRIFFECFYNSRKSSDQWSYFMIFISVYIMIILYNIFT